MQSIFLGEFMGTATLLYLGNGVVANMLLKGTKGNGTGLLAIAAAWGFAVTMGIYVSTYFGSPDAHLNPVVTVWKSVASGDWALAGDFILGQMLGAMIGQVLVYLHYKNHFDATEDATLIRASFCTDPAMRNIPSNLFSEALASVILVIALGAFGSVQDGLGPFRVGLLVWGIGLSLGGTTGYAINPARDLGPRIIHALLPLKNKGNSDWTYGWIPVVGPILGAIIGAYLLKLV